MNLVDPTGLGLASAIKALPHVQEATVVTTNPGHGEARIKLKWYAVLSLGVMHIVTRKRAVKILRRFGAAGIYIVVRFV